MSSARDSLYKTLAYTFAFIVLSLEGYSQQDFVNALNENLIPIETTDPNADFEDIERLGGLLADKRIIALGEATHGTKEFFLYKSRLVKYLVTRLGFKTFVIEADFAGTQAMNEYVLEGKGNVKDALTKMAIGVWFRPEFVDMVNWIKDFNSTRSNSEKVRFYGCDMQYAFNSAAAIRKGEIKIEPLLSPVAERGLDLMAKWNYSKFRKEDLATLKQTEEELKKTKVIDPDIERNRFSSQCLQTVIQTIEYAKQDYRFVQDVVRDKYMAENLEWISKLQPGKKIILWAHNLHIAKDFTNNKNYPMGYYLAKNHKQEYYAMGFGFSAGSLETFDPKDRKTKLYYIPPVRIKNSSDYYFSRAATPNFILDFKTAASIPVLSSFLNRKLHSRAIGGYYNPVKQEPGAGGAYQSLIRLYDAIIFFKETTASTTWK